MLATTLTLIAKTDWAFTIGIQEDGAAPALSGAVIGVAMVQDDMETQVIPITVQASSGSLYTDPNDVTSWKVPVAFAAAATDVAYHGIAYFQVYITLGGKTVGHVVGPVQLVKGVL